MDEMTLSHMADMIIVFGGCGALCGLVGGIVANGICLLIDAIQVWRKKRKEKKNDVEQPEIKADRQLALCLFRQNAGQPEVRCDGNISVVDGIAAVTPGHLGVAFYVARVG